MEYSQSLRPGVHNAKAEERTTPYMRQNITYMRQNIKTIIGVGGLHGNQFVPPNKSGIECDAQAVYQLLAAIPDEYETT